MMTMFTPRIGTRATLAGLTPGISRKECWH